MFIRIAVAIALGLASLACRSESVFSVECSFPLIILDGDQQQAPVSTTLPASLRVAVSGDNMFCWGPTDVAIQWTVETGGGSLSQDAVDRGSAEWTLGPNAGAQSVRARWTNPTANAGATTVVFTATALPPVQ